VSPVCQKRCHGRGMARSIQQTEGSAAQHVHPCPASTHTLCVMRAALCSFVLYRPLYRTVPHRPLGIWAAQRPPPLVGGGACVPPSLAMAHSHCW
jgi:hypothetical protein